MRLFELFEETKTFGSIVPFAIEAYSKLSPQAKNAVDSWNVNWSTGPLEKAFQSKNNIAQEISAAFEPVKEKLRSIYGDRIPLYRGEKNISKPGSAESRLLFSWTPDKQIAINFATNSPRGVPKEIDDSAIKSAIDRYNKTGFTTFSQYKFIRSKDDPDFYNIYDRNNQSITDGDDLEEMLKSMQKDRLDRINSMQSDTKIHHTNVPIDSIVWIPLGGNLHHPEYIATYNPRKY